MKKFYVLLSLVICFTFCYSPAVLYAEDVTEPAVSEEITSGTEDVTEPTEDVTEPTEDVTLPTDSVTEPTEEEELPSEEITEPEEIIEKSIKITASVGKTGKVTVSWESVSAEAVYVVMRAAVKGGNYSGIATLSGTKGKISYTDRALVPAEIRYYKVVRLKGDEAVRTSNITSVKMPLTPPAAVKTSLSDGKYVKIRWNKVAGASGYKVYRSLQKNSGYKLLKTVTAASYVDKSVYSGEGFYYKVRAYKKNVDSVSSKLSSYAAYYTKPAVPVISTKNSNGSVKVSWKAVKRAQLYYIYRKNADGKYVKIGESKNLYYTDKKGKKNAFVYYKVRSVYKQDGKTLASGYSKSSNVLTRYVNPNKKMVALTFDDGPSKHTTKIVNCLFKYDSAATFFVVGNRVNSYKSTVLHAYNRGCEIANHSYSHPLLTDLSSDKIKSQIRKTDNRVKAITGVKPVLVRVPYGGYSSKVKKAVGKPMIQWSDDTLDWKTRSKSATVNYVMKHVQDGDIILMHDIHEPTMKAALELIPKLKKKGYQIVTVSELAKYQGYNLKKGKVYFSFR